MKKIYVGKLLKSLGEIQAQTTLIDLLIEGLKDEKTESVTLCRVTKITKDVVREIISNEIFSREDLEDDLEHIFDILLEYYMGDEKETTKVEDYFCDKLFPLVREIE